MAIDRFIPTIWSTQLLLELRKNLVYGQAAVINTDYQGEISAAGDTVRIHNFGAVNVFDYLKNTDMTGPQTLTDAETTLTIDQAKAFNFQIDDIDRAQQTPKIMAAVMSDAAYRLADVLDQFIAGHYVDAGITLGSDATPVVPTKATAYEILVDLGTELSEANVPTAGRWVVIPPWFYGLLLKDDRFVATGSAQADAVLRNGIMGRAAGFDVYQSNNVPNNAGGAYKILASTNVAWSMAQQINGMEAYRPEKRFGDAVKGLHLYGAKVVRPNTLACLTADKTAAEEEEIEG